MVEISEQDGARLEAIKRDGRARRSRRHRRNVGIATLSVVAFAGVSIVAVQTTSGNDPAPQAARGVASEKCRESTDPSCGPFRWDPVPERNQALRVTLHVAPDQVATGEPVQATVSWADSDAPRGELVALCWGDSTCEPPAAPCLNDRATGTWTPPEPAPGRDRFLPEPHHYSAPGTYVVSVTVRSHAWFEGQCPPSAGDPYASSASRRAVVTVT